MSDELALREALHDLVIGQPAAPVDRTTSVRRRHVRRRMAQAGGVAVVAAVAFVGSVVGLTAGTRHVTTTPTDIRSVPSWALPWPDHRDGSVPQQVLDGAVLAWRQQTFAGSHPLPLPRPTVVWYVGQTVAADAEIVAIFEIDAPTGPRLVAAVRDDSGADASWTVYDAPAPAPSYRNIVGINAHGATADAQGNLHDWPVVLAPPGAVRLYVGGGIGYRPLHDGLAVFDAGAVTGRIEVAALRSDGTAVGGGYVGVPGALTSQAPQLAFVPQLTGVPSRADSLGEGAGQGTEQFTDDTKRRAGLPTTIYARCLGPGAITVVVDQEGTSATGVRVPCDGTQHTVSGEALTAYGWPYGQHGFEVRASALDAWRVAVVVG